MGYSRAMLARPRDRDRAVAERLQQRLDRGARTPGRGPSRGEAIFRGEAILRGGAFRQTAPLSRLCWPLPASSLRGHASRQIAALLSTTEGNRPSRALDLAPPGARSWPAAGGKGERLVAANGLWNSYAPACSPPPPTVKRSSIPLRRRAMSRSLGCRAAFAPAPSGCWRAAAWPRTPMSRCPTRWRRSPWRWRVSAAHRCRGGWRWVNGRARA